MKTGIKIKTEYNPNLLNPKTIEEIMVITQLINLNKVIITINGTLPTLMNSKHFAQKPGS